MSPDSRLSVVTRDLVAERILAEARRDPRIAGLADYGSSNRGQGDELSDLDVAVFVRDADMDVFEAEWKAWAAQFGPLLLAYISGVGHPWVVYEATPGSRGGSYGLPATTTTLSSLAISWPCCAWKQALWSVGEGHRRHRGSRRC